MSLELTDDQRARRAETARANGRKSRGPKTLSGKFITSLNAISTGAHADVRDARLPADLALLSTDDRRAYVRLLQDLVRQLRPQSEAELELVRQAANEYFSYLRLQQVETWSDQVSLDTILRELPTMGDRDSLLHAYRRSFEREDRFHRSLERRKAAHLRAYHTLRRSLRDLQRHHAVVPPELPDMTADSDVATPLEPNAMAIDELRRELAAVENNPKYVPLPYILELIEEPDFIAKYAPAADLAKVRRHLGRPPLAPPADTPKAA